MNKTKENKSGLKGFLIRIGIIGTAVFVTLFFFIGIHIYHSNNMAPWLRDGDLVFFLKTTTDYPDRVVCYKTDSGDRFGRVVGIAGDEIKITDNTYTINGAVPVEKVYYDTTSTDKVDIVVPEGHVFILNDMREDLNDSRTYRVIPVKDIKGSVFFTMSRRGF